MKIYSALGVELLDLIVDDKSYRYKVIMDENTMTLYFNMPDFHEIPEGSYCDYKNERYFLLDPENFKQINSRNFEYTLVLDSFQALTKQVKYKFFTMNGNTVDSPFELKFSLTATPAEFAQLLVNNMNISDAVGGWSVGECIESDPVCIDFNHDWCYDVLPKVSDAFKTEWEFENKTLHIRKVEKMKESPIPLKYGYDCGLLPGVSRTNASNAKVITRLFIEGGDRNIDKSTYGSSALRMPKNHTITYMGIDYKTDATGTYIERVTPLGRLKEGSLDVTKIYPKRVGTISAVNVVNADTNLYDVIDSSIPGTLDFSALVIAGETMTLIFQTGQLAGKEFEVKYKSADKRFELVPLSENGLNYPSGSIVPEIGDKYAVFNVSLPTDYITSAETDVLNAAVKYLWENEQPKYTVTGTLDALYAKRNWLAIGGFLNCGYFVSLTSDEFLPTPIDIRIVAVKEFINKPKEPEITLSNEVSGKTLGSELNKTSTQEQAINRKDAEVVRFARRQFSDIKQTTEMLQNSLLNFSSSISPLTVQTMQLIAGDETLQFVFVANSNSVAAVAHNEIYNPTTKQFISAAGVLQHKTLGVTTLSSTHAASELKWWNMTAFVSAILDDSSKSYYLYAKVSKTANTGVFLLSETAIALESVAGYYHLLMGILNSENDGDRSYSQMYGYSELTPARMTVKKVVSPSGNTFFDLENEVIQGNIKFQSGVAVETGISNAKSEAVQLASNDATTKANSAKDTAISTASADATAKANAANQTAQDYATAQAELAELNAKAHADGIVTAEEQRAINDATIKANNAQTAAINAAAIDATSKANAAIQTSKEYSDAKVAVINQSISDLQTQQDGEISNWSSNTQSEAPTLSNYPANQWTSDTIRDRHILDVYTNFQTYVDDSSTPNAGKSWKFGKLNGVYSWALIADNNQSKAYLLAAKAQTTANRKVTTYNSIPNTVHPDDGFCYRKGDLWSLQAAWNGFIAGELLSASQDSTSFVSSDWTKWVRYTGDEAVNNLVIGGVNLLDDSSSERTSGSEYLFAANLAPVFDIYGLGQYTFSFDLKVAVDGTIQVYCSDRNWDERKYDYVQSSFNVTTEYKRYSMIVNVTAANQLVDVCSLAFYGQYGTGVSPFVKNIQIELGSKATGYNISLADSKKAVADVKVIADNAQTAANTANSSISSLNTYVDGSFKDGVISTSEAQAIEKYKNQVTKDFNDLIAGYNVIYANTYLVGSAKTDLLNAKVTMSGAKDNLLTSINTAIADGKTTVSEKADVDTKYSAWDSSYSTYKSKLELANKAIQANLDSIAQTAASNAQVAATAVANTAQASANTAQSTIDNLNISTKNLVSGDGSELLVYGYVAYNALMKRGKEYCGTIMAKSDRTVNYSMYFLDSVTGSFASAGITLTTTYQQFSIRGICPNWWNEATGILIVYQPNGSIPIWTKEVSVVEGGKPMLAWMASPEYTDSKINDLNYLKLAIKGSASINGGLVLGNVMAVTDENGNVMAGMNGLAGAQYPIWSGAADAANANFSVDKYGNIKANGGAVLANGAISYNSDGTGQIGNGAMTWDALKRLIVNMTNFKIDVNGNVSVYGNLLQQSTSFAIDSLSKSLSVTNFAYRCQRVYGYHASPAVFTLSFPAGIVNGTRFSMYINNRIVVDGSGTNVSVSSYLLVNSNINLIYKNGVNGGQGNIIIAANSMAILEGVYVSDSLGIGTNTPSFVLGTMTVMIF